MRQAGAAWLEACNRLGRRLSLTCQFERRIPLSADLEADKVAATFKNGVLKVEIPKSKQAQERARRITIG